MREGPDGTQATVTARYDFGEETRVDVEGKSAAAVEAVVADLVAAGRHQKKSGESSPPSDDIVSYYTK